jgi:hypothetical protein
MSNTPPALAGYALVDRYALQLAVEALEHFDRHVYTSDGVQSQIDGSLPKLREALVQPADPLDTPLPCDVTVGHGTHRRGTKLRSLVTRMKVLYEMAGLYGGVDHRVLSQAALDVMAERQRQITAEGWTPDHDDEHTDGEMAMAAACYAASSMSPNDIAPEPPAAWPWPAEWWKPGTPERMLEKAGALIQAELERLHRANAKAEGAE